MTIIHQCFRYCPFLSHSDYLTWDNVTWDYVTWDYVTWDYVTWDYVTWDYVTWDYVSDKCLATGSPWTKQVWYLIFQKKSQRIALTKKLGIPLESITQPGLTKKQLQTLDKMNEGQPKANPSRKKDETPEERRERKALVKEQRKVYLLPANVCQEINPSANTLILHTEFLHFNEPVFSNSIFCNGYASTSVVLTKD